MELQTDFAYNSLNLLEKVVRNDTIVANYSYLADGTKLSVTDTEENGLYYLGSLVYEKHANTIGLEGGGRIVGTNDGANSEVHYFLTDHLGSTRVVARVTPTGREDLDRKDYYPFGKEWAQPDMPTSDNRYTFSGKEKQHLRGQEIDYADFEARFYDSDGVMFIQQDPLLEKYVSWSPYNYCTGNPIRFIDYQGKHPVVIGVGIALVEATLLSAGVITTGYLLTKNNDGSISLKNYGSWGDRQERKAADEKRLRELNMQNSIKENFPDPDDYDPNNNPKIRRSDKKGFLRIVIGATVIYIAKELFGGYLIYLDDNTHQDNADNTNGNTNNSGNQNRTNDENDEQDNTNQNQNQDQNNDRELNRLYFSPQN